MVSVQDRITLVRSEADQLQQYLSDLPNTAWERPSACDLWTVADVVGHLTWAADYFMATISNGIKGNQSPVLDWPAPGSLPPAGFADFIAQKAIEARQEFGDGLVSAFFERNSQLQELVSRLTPEELDQPCFSPSAARPARDFVSIRVRELSVHGWDIQSRLETSAGLSEASLPVVLEQVPQWLAGRGLSEYRPPVGRDSARYRLDLAGASSPRFDILATRDGCNLEDASGDPDVTLRWDGEATGLLAYGRLRLESALSRGAAPPLGDQQLAADFQAWLGVALAV